MVGYAATTAAAPTGVATTAKVSASRWSLLAQAAATRYNEASSCLPTKAKMPPNLEASLSSISPPTSDDFTSLDIKTNGKIDNVGVTSRTLSSSSCSSSSPSTTTSSDRGEFAPSITALPSGDDDEGVVTDPSDFSVFFQAEHHHHNDNEKEQEKVQGKRQEDEPEKQEKDKDKDEEDFFVGAKQTAVQVVASAYQARHGGGGYRRRLSGRGEGVQRRWRELVQQEADEVEVEYEYKEEEEEDESVDHEFDVRSAPSKLEKTRWAGATANLLPKQQRHRAPSKSPPVTTPQSSFVMSNDTTSRGGGDDDFDARSSAASSWTSSLPSHEEEVPPFAQFGAREVQLGRQLGRGGFNDVYEVRSLNLETTSTPAQEEQRVALARHCLFENGFPRFVVKFVRIHSAQEVAEDESSASAASNADEAASAARRRVARIRHRERVGATDLLTEATFLQSVVSDHPNIIQLRGIVFEEGEDGITQGILLDRLYDTLEQRIQRWKQSASSSSSFSRRHARRSFSRRGNRRRPAVMGKSSSCFGCLQSLASQVLPSSWNSLPPHEKFVNATAASSPPLEQARLVEDEEEDVEEEQDFLVSDNLEFRLRVALEICCAIRHLHEHDVLHRDIKPSNIGFDMEDRVKLFDFGLAYPLVSLEDGSRRSRPQGIAGAPRYMSREVAMGQSYERPADCYSFSLVLWEIMSRQTPIFADITTRAELMSRVMMGGERPAVPTSSSPDEWPPAVTLFIQAGWSATPRERPTMQQYCAVLQRVLDELQLQQ